MEKKRLACAVFLCLALSAAACGGGDIIAPPAESASPVELRANLDRAVANPGDVITFTLEAEYQPDVNLELPEIPDRFSDFRIANAGSAGPAKKGERVHVERWYKLQADMPGSFVVEPVEVAYTLADGTRESLKTPKIFIEIESLLAQEGETEDIKDIKPPIEISHPYRMLLVILAALAAIAVAVVLGKKLFELWRRRALERKLSPRPAHEEALEALDKLLAKGLIEKGRAREFCFEISEIFRRYMHARFDVPAIDLTTEEILPRIEDNGIIGQTLKPVVREFLTGADLVKFAKHQPTRSETDRMIESTRTFINETAFAPAATEQNAGGDTA